MIAMLDLDAHPHNSRPQVHMGAMNGFVEFEFIVDRGMSCREASRVLCSGDPTVSVSWLYELSS